MENETKNFKADLFKLAWFMRGGVTWKRCTASSARRQRSSWAKVIKDNLDTAKKTGQPFF